MWMQYFLNFKVENLTTLVSITLALRVGCKGNYVVKSFRLIFCNPFILKGEWAGVIASLSELGIFNLLALYIGPICIGSSGSFEPLDISKGSKEPPNFYKVCRNVFNFSR